MADVLSQAQIDALLNQVRNESKDLEKPAEEKQKKYQKYDFSSPRKFNRDRIKMLNGVFDSYARLVGSRLNARLRSNYEITVESVEEQRYYEFSNALSEGDVLALASVQIKEKEEEEPVMFYLATGTALGMMDRLMGGEGEPDPQLPSNYNMTDLELQMYENIIRDLVSPLGSSWENYISLQFKYVRTEVNPTLVQLIGFDETVVIVGLTVKFPNITGRLSICLPGNMLANIFTEISKSSSRRVTGEDKSEEIFDNLRESELEIVAELARTHLLLSDIYHLNVGDVVDIKRPKDSVVYLNIGGRRWFDGKMGVYNKQMTVKVGETYIKA